jgi:hypothetical protein
MKRPSSPHAVGKAGTQSTQWPFAIPKKGQFGITFKNKRIIRIKMFRFIFFSARGTGRMHDQRVCELFTAPVFEGVPQYRPFPGSIIIGDSAYRGRDWLLPLRVSNNEFLLTFYT